MTATRNSSNSRLRLETLEGRLALTSYLQGGDIVVNVTNGNDVVTVTQQSSFGVGSYTVTENGVASRFVINSVVGGRVLFYGHAGDDFFRNDTTLRAVAFGMDGNDTLVGGSAADHLDGGTGADALYGQAGDDNLLAGNDFSLNTLVGDDGLYGGQGNDLMYGQGGSDTLVGSAGNDALYGGAGTDFLYGQAGDDILSGGAGTYDYLNGGAGRDSFERDLVWMGTTRAERDFRADFVSGVDRVHG